MRESCFERIIWICVFYLGDLKTVQKFISEENGLTNATMDDGLNVAAYIGIHTWTDIFRWGLFKTLFRVKRWQLCFSFWLINFPSRQPKLTLPNIILEIFHSVNFISSFLTLLFFRWISNCWFVVEIWSQCRRQDRYQSKDTFAHRHWIR